MESGNPESALNALQQKMSKIFENTETKGEIPLSDRQACDLMGAAEALYQIYLSNPPLVKDATMEMYGVLNEYVNQFAAERGVRFETQSRSQYASASQ